MYQRINQHDFIDAFRRFDRLDVPDAEHGGNFTIDGCRALFEYLEELENELYDDEHPGLQLDPLGLCCDFAEYDTAIDCAYEYADRDLVEQWHKDDPETVNAAALDYLRDQTTVIEIPGTDRIIIQQF